MLLITYQLNETSKSEVLPSKQFQQEFQASDDGSILFIKQIKTEKAFLDFLKE